MNREQGEWKEQVRQLIAHDLVKVLLFATFLVLLSSFQYLSAMAVETDVGLVFDDSFIHLQFARTIHEGIAWQYNPGEISTGSTSPLWSITLSFLFFLTSDSTSLLWGVHFVSVLFYIASTFLVGYIVMTYISSLSWSLVAMAGFVFLPRNTLLMLSGMETPLFLFLILLSLAVMDRQEQIYDSIIGIIAGLIFLARPEGALIALVCVPVRFLILDIDRRINRARLISLMGMYGYTAVIASSWMLFCLHSSGYLLPATFYVKASVTDFAIEAWDGHWIFWFGQYPYLLPSIFFGALLVLYKKPHPWLFAITLALAYRFTLPYNALINHARYLVPVFDLLALSFILGIAQLQNTIIQWISASNSFRHAKETETPIKVATIAIVCLFMVASIAPQYSLWTYVHATEVRNTNERQVLIGQWLKENTPEDAVIAIHDAGAIRFFSERRIIDLVGLVTPEIAFGNMTSIEILSYLRAEGCEYFVFFNRLFTYWGYLLGGAYTILYEAFTEDCILPDNANMTVYQINWSLTSY